MTDKTMTDDRLRELIEAYGADTSNFPFEERAAAEARLFEAPEKFLLLLTEARELDDGLRSLPDAFVPGPLRDRLITYAKARPGRRGWRWNGWLLPDWAPVGALASVVIGVLAGLAIGAPTDYLSEDEAAEAYVYAALGYTSLDLLEDAQE